MGEPRSPEDRAAANRAAWNRKVAQTAAKEASQREAATRKAALHAAAIVAKANALHAEGRPFNFPTLGVAVLDGIVYVTKGGPRALGPLTGASAAVKLLPPRVVRKSVANQLIFGNAPIEQVARVEVTVLAGGASHREVVENTWKAGFGSTGGVSTKAEHEARDFNVLVGQARR